MASSLIPISVNCVREIRLNWSPANSTARASRITPYRAQPGTLAPACVPRAANVPQQAGARSYERRRRGTRAAPRSGRRRLEGGHPAEVLEALFDLLAREPAHA